MALQFSHSEYALLHMYVQSQGKETKIGEKLLQRCKSNGIDLQSLADIKVEVSPNPMQLKFSPTYLADRVEGALRLRDCLQNTVSLERCYQAIDQLVFDEYEGRFGAAHNKAEEILDSALSWMRDPKQKASSFRNRRDAIPAINAFFGGLIVGATEAFFTYQATHSGLYAMFASVVGVAGGIALTVYVDSWFNHELAPAVRKRRGIDAQDSVPLLQRRLNQKKERYEKLCRIASGI